MLRVPQFTVVDDDNPVLLLLRHVLSKAFPACQINSFLRSELALWHIQHHGTDLLITDHNLGPMQGTDLIRHLRERNFDAPIIMISNDPKAREEALQIGANAFMDKGSILKELPELVHDLLKEHLAADKPH